MHAPDPRSDHARRELVLVAVLLVGLGRLVERPDAFLVAALLPVVILIAGLGILGDGESRTRPFEALLIPAVAQPVARPRRSSSCLRGSASSRSWPGSRSCSTGRWCWRCASSPSRRVPPRRIERACCWRRWSPRSSPSRGSPPWCRAASPEPGGATSGSTLTEIWLLVLAVDDALIALLLGYRVATFRYGTLRGRGSLGADVRRRWSPSRPERSARSDLPLLVGPAVLTLVFYLWDALHGTAPARRREPRFLWETILLVVLAVVVVAWNLLRLSGPAAGHAPTRV